MRGTSTSSVPNLTCHPSGEGLAFAGKGCVEIRNIWTKGIMRKEKELRNNNYRSCHMSPNGTFLATIAKCSQTVELGVMMVTSSRCTNVHMIECHKVCPGFKASPTYTDRLSCRFSPGSAHIAACSSLGFLFVVHRLNLEHYCNVIPGMFTTAEARLANERCFDFDPRFEHRQIAFGSDSRIIYLCDINEGDVIHSVDLPVFGDMQCLRYSPSGRLLAVATSEAKILILCSDTLDAIHTLDATVQCDDAMMHTNSLGYYPEMISLSFSSCGQQLAVSSTDCYIRIWQLPPEMSLQYLCRHQLLQLVSTNAIKQLPLPNKLINFLLVWPR